MPKWKPQLAFLDALASSPNFTATSDDATTDLFAKFKDGGCWRGPAIRELAIDGFIIKVGAQGSSRLHRHCGTLYVWQGTDRQQINNYREVLRKALAEWPDEPPQEPPAAAAILSPTSPPPTTMPGAMIRPITPGMEANV